MARFRVTLLSLAFALCSLLPGHMFAGSTAPSHWPRAASVGSPLRLAVPVTTGARVEGANVTGTWSGSGPLSFQCDNGKTMTSTVNVTMTLSDTNDVVVGTLEIDNIPDTDSACNVIGTLPPIVGPLSGSVSGSTFNANATLPGDNGRTIAFTLSATVSGSSMSLSGGGDGATFSGTASQTSSASPDTSLTGIYSGTITGVFIPCGVLAPINVTGTATASIVQAGSTILGTVTVTGQKTDKNRDGICTVLDAPPQSVYISAQVSGNTISGTTTEYNANNKTPRPFTGTISGGTITITDKGDYSGESATVVLNKVSSGSSTPMIISFGASPLQVTPGQTSTLSWSTFNTTSVSIDNGVGAQSTSGSVTVKPSTTTTYVLTAQGSGGSATAAITVEVVANPQLVISAMPRGMLTVPGATASDAFTVTNTGGSDAQVTVAISGSSFSAAPTTFPLAAGASNVVVIHASSSATGTFNGTATVSIAGSQQQVSIPLSLFVAAPPSGTVVPAPVAPRVEVASASGQNPNGSVQFTNSGSATLQGIAVADVPWISAQTGVITIAPGATATVNFNIDRSQRPDAGIGGVAGTISLLYLGSASGKTGVALGSTPVNSVSVTIVDVVKPTTSAAAPPALGSGELAYVISGLTSNAGRAGDLYFSSRGTSPQVSDVKIYYTPGASTATKLVTAIPPFAPNYSVGFPSLLKNVFGAFPSSVPVQLRSSDAPNLSVAALLSALRTDGLGARVASVPVLRSDRTAGAGEKIVLPMPPPSAAANTGTRVFAQEMSGGTGSAQFDYYDAAGKPLPGSGAVQINPFASIIDDAPDGTASVVLTNTATNGSRLAGYVLVHNEGTPAGLWSAVDPSRAAGAAADRIIVPLAATASGVQQDLFITNGSGASANVSVSVVSPSGRRHAAKVTAAGAQPLANQSYTIAPLATQQAAVGAANGYVLVAAPAGAVSVAGRLIGPERNGQYQTGLPAVAAAAALGASQAKRFTAVDDASSASIAARTPQTYRTSLILIETAGQSATVHVTLRYTFASGNLTSSQAAAARDFTITPGQMLVVSDLARSIIGSQRDTFGDLRNMQVDVSVDGSGKVIPFIESTDNSSGDVSIRSE